MKVAIINGSSTAPSSADAVVDVFVQQVAESGFESEVVHVYQSGIPLVIDEAHESVQNIRRVVSGSEAVVLISPLYHGGYSGLIKLFLDQLDRDALLGKKVVLVSISSNLRNSQVGAQDLIPIIWTMKGNVHRLVAVSGEDIQKDEQGTRVLKVQEVKDRIALICVELRDGISR